MSFSGTADEFCGNERMIRIALIGCGYWGKKLLRVFNKLENVEVAYVCDQQFQKQIWISEHYPEIAFCFDYQSILDRDFEAVVIATPANAHYEIAKDFLEAGKHVFVEKPLALYRIHAEDLKSRAKHKNLKLFVGHIFEFDPAIETIQKIIQSERLGEIYYFDSVRANLGILRLDINVVWDLLVHDITILHAIFNQLPGKVSVTGNCYLTKDTFNLCEMCNASMILPSGINASVKASWLEPFKTRQIKIIGSEGSLIFDPTRKNRVEIFEGGIELSLLGSELDVSCRQGECHEVAYSDDEPLVIEAKAFIDSILRNRVTNASVAVEIISVLESMQVSLEQNGLWQNVNVAVHHPSFESLLQQRTA